MHKQGIERGTWPQPHNRQSVCCRMIPNDLCRPVAMKPPVTLKSMGCQIPCAIVNLLPTWKAVPQSDPQPPLEQKKQVLRPTQNSAKKTNESQQNKAPIIWHLAAMQQGHTTRGPGMWLTNSPGCESASIKAGLKTSVWSSAPQKQPTCRTTAGSSTCTQLL